MRRRTPHARDDHQPRDAAARRWLDHDRLRAAGLEHPARAPRRASYQVKTTCQPGLWRVAAEAHGAGPTGISFRFADYSVPAIISCSKGK